MRRMHVTLYGNTGIKLFVLIVAFKLLQKALTQLQPLSATRVQLQCYW